MDVIIEEGQLDDAIWVLKHIPEMQPTPDRVQLEQRLAHAAHLILTVKYQGVLAGCKLGYVRDGKFYSWLGGVTPSYRQSGLAALLADYQENWARQAGFSCIWMKTRNAFPFMLMMAIRRGFRITKIEPREDLLQNRIFLEKAF